MLRLLLLTLALTGCAPLPLERARSRATDNLPTINRDILVVETQLIADYQARASDCTTQVCRVAAEERSREFLAWRLLLINRLHRTQSRIADILAKAAWCQSLPCEEKLAAELNELSQYVEDLLEQLRISAPVRSQLPARQ